MGDELLGLLGKHKGSMGRLYTANDVRSYARCPRQWWYEARSEELAALSPDEVRRRLDRLRRRHGAAADDLPAYRLLSDLAAREQSLAHGRETHRAHAVRALSPAESRGRGSGCLPLAGLVLLAVATALLLLAPL